MLTNEQILEIIAEAIREKRRWGPNFSNTWELSKVLFDVDSQRVFIDLLDDGVPRQFDLELHEVSEHGEEYE